MRYLIERTNYYKIGDTILIHYWYNNMITVVSIIDIVGKKYKVTHNIEDSKIKNAPDEMIHKHDIIDSYRK